MVNNTEKISSVKLNFKDSALQLILRKLAVKNCCSFRSETHILFRTQSVIVTLRGKGGGIPNDVLKFRKIIEFQSS